MRVRPFEELRSWTLSETACRSKVYLSNAEARAGRAGDDRLHPPTLGSAPRDDASRWLDN